MERDLLCGVPAAGRVCRAQHAGRSGGGKLPEMPRLGRQGFDEGEGGEESKAVERK